MVTTMVSSSAMVLPSDPPESQSFLDAVQRLGVAVPAMLHKAARAMAGGELELCRALLARAVKGTGATKGSVMRVESSTLTALASIGEGEVPGTAHPYALLLPINAGDRTSSVLSLSRSAPFSHEDSLHARLAASVLGRALALYDRVRPSAPSERLDCLFLEDSCSYWQRIRTLIVDRLVPALDLQHRAALLSRAALALDAAWCLVPDDARTNELVRAALGEAVVTEDLPAIAATLLDSVGVEAGVRMLVRQVGALSGEESDPIEPQVVLLAHTMASGASPQDAGIPAALTANLGKRFSQTFAHRICTSFGYTL
jgi:hypothetical protein